MYICTVYPYDINLGEHERPFEDLPETYLKI